MPLWITLTLALAVLASEGAPGDSTWTVEPVVLPSDDTARFPAIHEHAGGLDLLWTEDAGEGGHRLRYVDFGARAGEPVTVAEGTSWFVNWADVPAVSRAGTRLVATWLERLGSDTYAYGIRWAHSADGGRSWSEPAWLHDDLSPQEHGFASFAPLDGGRAAVFWLDGRDKGALEGGHGTGNMTLRAAVIDDEGRRGAELVLDERVCDCCPTAAARLSSSRVAVAFRDRSPREVRDVGVLRGDVDTGVFERAELAGDGWEIAGCPVNGPALAAAGERIAVAWYTGADGRSSVRLAGSTDGACSFGEPREVSLGNPIGRAEVEILADGTLLVVWCEFRPDAGASWMGRSYDDELRAGEPFRIGSATGGRDAGHAAVGRLGDGVLVVWTDGRSENGGGLRAARLTRASEPTGGDSAERLNRRDAGDR